MLGYSAGLDLSNLDETSQEEVDAHLMGRWAGRGPTYELGATSLMTDYSPKLAKLHWLGADIFRRLPSLEDEPDDRRITIPNSLQQLYSYMALGWETGIRNQFRVLHRWGFTRAQMMEVVLFGRLMYGMRGLGHVWQAVGEALPDYADGDGNVPWPDGWAADPDAFKCGLDLTTASLTDQDRTNLIAWYENTIGYLPRSISFGIEHDPRVLKNHRAMWEIAIQTLPKQVAPYLMIRDATLVGDRDALREATLLGRAWGVSADLMVRAATQTMHYFTGLRGLYAAHDAMDDILKEMKSS